ncbi:hypothetical protein KSP40_PGU013704 [Platanthera guangdongensis]|uniref:Uncharacterized protein n=1 Tax=Platanthera guangdongensis TaxID=2320717 RepID=A0ABR2LT24_9ASPA
MAWPTIYCVAFAVVSLLRHAITNPNLNPSPKCPISPPCRALRFEDPEVWGLSSALNNLPHDGDSVAESWLGCTGRGPDESRLVLTPAVPPCGTPGWRAGLSPLLGGLTLVAFCWVTWRQVAYFFMNWDVAESCPHLYKKGAVAWR